METKICNFCKRLFSPNYKEQLYCNSGCFHKSDSGKKGLRRKGTMTQRRKDMGEEKWAKYQKERTKQKKVRQYLKNPFYVSARSRALKKILIEYKGGKCSSCGYDKPFISVYCFHHLDSTQKKIKFAGSKYNLKALKKEADKCLLLCHNCHFELHEKVWLKRFDKNNGEKDDKQNTEMARTVCAQLDKVGKEML